MEIQEFTEEDWKLFRSKIVGWQEAYMDKLNKEYIELLSTDDNPAEKFWKLEERVNQDKKKKGVVLETRRSRLIYNICNLINEGAITMEDLEGFSDILKERVRTCLTVY